MITSGGNHKAVNTTVMATSSSSKYNFEGKRALVTGAGRGIGRGIAIALAQAGAETYALSRTKKHIDQLVNEYPSIKPVCVDVSDWSATRLAVESLPPIDLLVNNAGAFQMAPFVDVKPEDFDQMFGVNVKSVLNVSQVVAKSMIARGSSGAIVNISSDAAVRAAHGLTVYCSTKGALDQMTRMMALELGPHKIRVNSVNPDVVRTDMSRPYWEDEASRTKAVSKIPLGRIIEVSEVVGPVMFLLSEEASMVHGAILMVDGGFTVA